MLTEKGPAGGAPLSEGAVPVRGDAALAEFAHTKTSSMRPKIGAHHPPAPSTDRLPYPTPATPSNEGKAVFSTGLSPERWKVADPERRRARRAPS